MRRSISFYSVVHLIIFLLSIVTDWYSFLVISLLVCLIVQILDRLGKGIVLREIVALHITFVCLLMPVIGYAVFNRGNHLARIFIKYMRVPEQVYFGAALPAIVGFILVLCWPIGTSEYDDRGPFLQKAVDRAK